MAKKAVGGGRRRRRRKDVGPLTCVHRGPGAWTVVVIRRGKRYTDYFPDGVWGGRGRSLVAAQRYRDDVLLRRTEPDTRVRRRKPRGASKETGIVGVTVEHYWVEDRRYTRAVAGWKDADMKVRRRRFSIDCYGYHEAIGMAAAMRKRGVAQARSERLARQRRAAAERIDSAPPPPVQVKDPLSRKGISMANRRPPLRGA